MKKNIRVVALLAALGPHAEARIAAPEAAAATLTAFLAG